jgi:toxin ParE1/3/4
MPFSVLLTDDAARDLEELYEFISQHDTPRRAQAVLSKIEKAFERLSESPDRGSRPKELIALGIQEYRQVFFKPYRIIYRTIDTNVYVLLIADGRRDMQSLLERRLLEAE